MTPGPVPPAGNGAAQRGLGNSMADLAEGMGRLMIQHFELAKLELLDGLKATGGDVGKIAAALPLLLIGYCFLCSGLAVVLARWLGVAGGLFAVGGLHILIGAAIALMGVVRMNRRKMMSGTSDELERTSAVFGFSNGNGTTTQELPNGR